MAGEKESSWLDKKFLENGLGKEIDSFEVKPMGGKNEYFTSSLFRVQVKLKSNEIKHLIVKKMLDNKGKGQSVRETSMFEREIHMYSVVLPKLSALLEKAIPGCEPIAPEYVFSSTGVLVLEDLSPSGFQMMDKTKGLDLHQSLLVMRTLARFQAASVILQQQEPESLKPYDTQTYSEPAMQESLAPFFSNILRLLADEIVNWSGYGERYSRKFRSMSERIMELIAEAGKRREGRFNVLTHDDLWINNILFKSPDSVRLIDFQMLHYASLGNDLQMFLTSSLNEEVRQNHFDTLLKEYHKTFCDVLTALDYNGRMLTFEDVKEEFIKSSSYCFLLLISFAPLVYAKADFDIPLFGSNNELKREHLFHNDRSKDAVIETITRFEKEGGFNVDS